MSVFDVLANTLFTDRNISHAALWKSDGIGAGVGVRVALIASDTTLSFGRSELVAPSTRIKVMRSAVSEPHAGDRVVLTEIGAEYEIIGAPKIGLRKLIWECEAKEIDA